MICREDFATCPVPGRMLQVSPGAGVTAAFERAGNARVVRIINLWLDSPYTDNYYPPLTNRLHEAGNLLTQNANEIKCHDSKLSLGLGHIVKCCMHNQGSLNCGNVRGTRPLRENEATMNLDSTCEPWITQRCKKTYCKKHHDHFGSKFSFCPQCDASASILRVAWFFHHSGITWRQPETPPYDTMFGLLCTRFSGGKTMQSFRQGREIMMTNYLQGTWSLHLVSNWFQVIGEGLRLFPVLFHKGLSNKGRNFC